MNTQPEPDKEIEAITKLNSVLKDLEVPAQLRVIEYLLKKLNLTLDLPPARQTYGQTQDDDIEESYNDENKSEDESNNNFADNGFTSISPVAQKWIQRNGLQAEQLSKIFSLGEDEIDLITNNVPGESKRAKMHNVFLLKGVAAYLSGGAARIAHDKVKEACMHYDAYDSPNFAKYLKQFAPEISGSKESGYTLTSRGLVNAAALVKQMLGLASAK